MINEIIHVTQYLAWSISSIAFVSVYSVYGNSALWEFVARGGPQWRPDWSWALKRECLGREETLRAFLEERMA